MQYLVQVPGPECHTHSLDYKNLVSCPVHPEILEKFRSLAKENVSFTVSYRALNVWISDEFVPAQNTDVDFFDFRIYPDAEQLRSVFHNEIEKKHTSKFDQQRIFDFVQDNSDNKNLFAQDYVHFDAYEGDSEKKGASHCRAIL